MENTTNTQNYQPENINAAREEVRHAARILNDIEDLSELNFDTLDIVARSLRNADKQLTVAIQQQGGVH